MCSRYTTGSFKACDSTNRSYASWGVEGNTITKPGSFANHDSIIFAWKGPLRVFAPSGILTVSGTSAPHRHLSWAALLISGFIAKAANPPNWISAKGRMPPRAAPVAE